MAAPTVVRDVVVVLPGIMGSELLDSDGRPLWSVGARGLLRAITTVGRELPALRLPDGIGDGPAPDGVSPGGLLPALHVVPGLWRPIAGYSGLMRFLTGARFHLVPPAPGRADRIPNLVPFAYDWRLSCRYNARRLATDVVPVLERWRAQPGMGDARLILVCHSMGGLVARWFLDCEGGAEITRALITVGTPHRGAARTYETLTSSLSPGVGPLRLPLGDFARSLPSLYQLLPQYRCLRGPGDTRTGLAEAGYPGLDTAMAADAAAFHDRIARPDPPSYGFHKVVGIRQPTATTVRRVDGSTVVSSAIDGQEQGGDGTVPRLAAEPVAGRGTELHEVAGQHGELHGTRSVLDLVDGILTRADLVFEDVEGLGALEGGPEPGVSTADVHAENEPVPVAVTGADGHRLVVEVRDESGELAGAPVPIGADGNAWLAPLPRGVYRALVRPSGRAAAVPVTHPFLVWPAAGIEDGDG